MSEENKTKSIVEKKLIIARSRKVQLKKEFESGKYTNKNMFILLHYFCPDDNLKFLAQYY